MAHLAQTRDLPVKQHSALKAKINNLLSSEGINLNKEALSSNKALNRVLVAQIRSLTGSIAELEELIEEEEPKLAGRENLISIKGIGPISAAVLLSVIGRIEDFSDPCKLADYVGLVPEVQNSTETEHSGRTTKQGNKLARTALVQCALIAKRTVPTSSISTNASNADAAEARPTSPWPPENRPQPIGVVLRQRGHEYFPP